MHLAVMCVDDERLPGGGAVPVRRADRCLPAAAGVVQAGVIQAGVVQAGQPSGTSDAHAQYTIDIINSTGTEDA
jgi:hypothetical protein